MLTRVIVALCCACILALPACTAPIAASRVASQNLLNARVLAANTQTIAALALAQSASLGEVRLHDARQRTAIALARVHASGEADLTPRIAALRAELAQLVTPPGSHRQAVYDALAAREPALIDIAAAEPYFTAQRVLDEAKLVDGLHARLDTEQDPPLRAALLARRDAILDPYALVRAAAAIAGADLAAMTDLRAALDEQSRIVLLHAQSLADFSAPCAPAAPAAPAAADLYHSPELRSLLLDTVEQARGRAARDRVSAWLTRADTALDVFTSSTNP